MLNQLDCAQAFANTGVGECDLIPTNIVGMYIVPASFRIKPEDDIAETLRDAAETDVQADRIYPVHNFVGVDDNTGDLNEETLGYGGVAVLSEGKYDLTFRIGTGGLCLQKRLRRYNVTKPRVLLIDANGMIFGQMVGQDLAGIPLELYFARALQLSDGNSTTTAFRVRIMFDPKYLNDNFGFINSSASGFMPSEIVGLQDLSIKDAGSSGTELKVTVKTGCGTEDTLEVFATELADDSLWVVTDADDGSAVTLSSVSIAGGVATLTITAGADRVKVNLVPVSDLVAAGIVGYEGQPAIITV